MTALAVEAEGLVKTFGSTRALDGVDVQIPHGTLIYAAMCSILIIAVFMPLTVARYRRVASR